MQLSEAIDHVRTSTVQIAALPKRTAGEIGAILQLSGVAIENHKVRAMRGLGVFKAVLLARVAIAFGVSPLADKLTASEKRRSGRRGDGWN